MKMSPIAFSIGLGVALVVANPAGSAEQIQIQTQNPSLTAAQKKEVAKAQAAARKAQEIQQRQWLEKQKQQQKIIKQEQANFKKQQEALQKNQAAFKKQQAAETATRQAQATAQKKVDEAKKAEAGKTVNAVVDKRQENQAKRIHQGVAKGYLTADELAKLATEQAAIEKLQQQLAGDGQVSKDDAVLLRSALKEASLAIWTEKHDAEGTQMPVFRLGKNIRLNPDVAVKLGDENLSKADARRFLADFRSLCQIKKQLDGDLAEDQRATLQKHYDDLLNQYFTVL